MSTQLPKIAEKIKFWEEQDQINKAVIPRILKAHDLATDLSEKFIGFSETVGKIEGRINEKITNNRETTHKEIEAFRTEFSESVNTEIKAIKEQLSRVSAPSRIMYLAIAINCLLSVAAIAISLIGK